MYSCYVVMQVPAYPPMYAVHQGGVPGPVPRPSIGLHGVSASLLGPALPEVMSLSPPVQVAGAVPFVSRSGSGSLSPCASLLHAPPVSDCLEEGLRGLIEETSHTKMILQLAKWGMHVPGMDGENPSALTQREIRSVAHRILCEPGKNCRNGKSIPFSLPKEPLRTPGLRNSEMHCIGILMALCFAQTCPRAKTPQKGVRTVLPISL